MAADAPQQRLHHRRAAAQRVIQPRIGLKPFAKQGGHGGGAGLIQLQSGDQETQHLHPMEQEGILQVAAGDGPKGAAQGRQLARLADQPEALAAQGGDHAGAGAQGQ